jgi:hypothetical protein
VKQRVYVETSIISYLVSRPSSDVRVAASQLITREWWEERSHRFDLFISEFVLTEAALGDSEAARSRLDALASIPLLAATEPIRQLGAALMTEGPIPTVAEIDAYHIAMAAVNGMDYLLTWNCTHIANASMRSKIEDVCRSKGYEPPTICTPQELMEDYSNGT